LQLNSRGRHGVSEDGTTTQKWQDAECKAQSFHRFQTMTDFGIATMQAKRHQRNETLGAISSLIRRRLREATTSPKGKNQRL
jgi:hypothetical protein